MNLPAPDERFRLSSADANELAGQFGTPLYVLSEATIADRVGQFHRAVQTHYPNARITYASKANGLLALLHFVYHRGCSVDVASEGELRASLVAGVPAAACTLHGNFKKVTELRYALSVGIGRIVVDSYDEMNALGALKKETSLPGLLLRLNPPVDPQTHQKIATATPDSKFGVGMESGEAEACVRYAAEHDLPLIGYHCHVGSQLMDARSQVAACRAMVRFGLEMLDKYRVPFRVLDLGGGLGVRYLAGDVPQSIDDFVRSIAAALSDALGDHKPEPTLVMEPGRAIVGEAGLTLYEVGPIKRATRRDGTAVTLVAVDGGLSDNPRPGLYGGKYEVAVDPGVDTMEAMVVGRHCETDVLIESARIPRDLAPGDVLQVLTTGAYSESMASNYNRFPKPATVWIDAQGSPSLVAQRERFEALVERELVGCNQGVAC
ncbi:MAG: diaminopimelate decarboxylase [Fimbriimonadaceae bacterium]